MYNTEDFKNRKSLTEDDLVLSEPYDRIFTHLILQDYDWMYYRLIADIPVSKSMINKTVRIEFVYSGSNQSRMFVEIRPEDYRAEITFNSRIFEKYIKAFMTEHLEGWDDEYAFYGGDLILQFFNDVLKNGEEIKPSRHYIEIPKQ